MRIKHSLNLPFAFFFFGAEILKNITGQSLYSTPLAIEMPNMSLFHKKWNKVVQAYEQFTLDLHKAVTAWTKDEPMFGSPTDELWYELQELSAAIHGHVGKVMTYAGNIAEGLSFVISISAPTLLGYPGMVNTLSLHRPLPATTPVDIVSYDMEWSGIQITLTILLICILICHLMYFLIKWFKKTLACLDPFNCGKMQTSTIILELTSPTKQVSLKITTLPLYPQQYTISKRGPITHLHVVRSCFHYHLSLKWKDLFIYVTGSPLKLPLLDLIPIPFYLVNLCKQILENAMTLRLLVETAGQYTVITPTWVDGPLQKQPYFIADSSDSLNTDSGLYSTDIITDTNDTKRMPSDPDC